METRSVSKRRSSVIAGHKKNGKTRPRKRQKGKEKEKEKENDPRLSGEEEEEEKEASSDEETVTETFRFDDDDDDDEDYDYDDGEAEKETEKHSSEEEEGEATKEEGNIFVVFNHKGGVGKTTSTVSLGWKLAERGHRVLLVDADPQCNLTGFVVDPGCELAEMEDWSDPLETFYKRFPKANIRASLAPLLGEENLCNELRVSRGTNLLTDVFRVSRRNEFWPKEANAARPPRRTPPKGLYLLAGHPSFHEYEAKIALATDNPSAYPAAPEVPGCFRELFVRLTRRHRFDYILVDMSPSISTINKLIIVSSDFLIVPCSPDFFSYMAIESLPALLLQWDDWKVQLTTRFQEPLFRLPETKPIFLGHTIQLYTIRSGVPAKAFRKWISKIGSTVLDELVPRLHRRGMAFPQEAYGENSMIAQIRNYNSLGPAASKCHLPPFALTSSMLKKAGAYANRRMRAMIADIDDTFTGLALALERRWGRVTGEAREELIDLQRSCHMLQRVGFPISGRSNESICAVSSQIKRLFERSRNDDKDDEDEEEEEEEGEAEERERLKVD